MRDRGSWGGSTRPAPVSEGAVVRGTTSFVTGEVGRDILVRFVTWIPCDAVADWMVASSGVPIGRSPDGEMFLSQWQVPNPKRVGVENTTPFVMGGVGRAISFGPSHGFRVMQWLIA